MGEQYNVFISWSGDRSKWVAQAIYDWLPLVIQAAKPWLSVVNIEIGARGLDVISGKLQGMKVGISCLTPENLAAPWILYEAGALSKTIDDKTRLCTYLLGGLKFQDVEPPLGMFQAATPNKSGTRKLLSTINSAVSDEPILEANLDKLFEKWWPELEGKIATMPKADHAQAPTRPTADLIAEILKLARAEAQNRESLQKQISHMEGILSRAPFAYSVSFGDVLSGAYTLKTEPLSSLSQMNTIAATPVRVAVANRITATDSETLTEPGAETGKKGMT